MRNHIRLVGILHIAWNLLHVLSAFLVLLVYFVGAGALGLASASSGEAAAGAGITAILTALGLLGGCAILAPSLPGFLAGIGLLSAKPWARWVIVVVSILYLFHLGLGTALGIYSLWALLSDEAEFVFRGPAETG